MMCMLISGAAGQSVLSRLGESWRRGVCLSVLSGSILLV